MDDNLQQGLDSAVSNWAAAGVPVTEDAAQTPTPVDTTTPSGSFGSPDRQTPDESTVHPVVYGPAPVDQERAPETHNWDETLADTTPAEPAPDLSRAAQAAQVPVVGGLFSALGSAAQTVNQAARAVPGVAGAEDWAGTHVGQGQWGEGNLNIPLGVTDPETGAPPTTLNVDTNNLGLGPAMGWFGEHIADPLAGGAVYGLSQAGRTAMRNLTGDEQMFPDVPAPELEDGQNPWERAQALGQWWRDAPYMSQIPEGARPAAAGLATVADFTNPAWDVGLPARAIGLAARGEAAVGRAVEAERAAEAAGQVAPRNPLTGLPIVGRFFEPESGAAAQAAREDSIWRAAQNDRLASEQGLMGGTPEEQAAVTQRFSPTGYQMPTPEQLDQPSFLRRGGVMPGEEPGNFPSMGRTPQETLQRLSDLQGESAPSYRWTRNPETGAIEPRPVPLNEGQSLWSTPDNASTSGRGPMAAEPLYDQAAVANITDRASAAAAAGQLDDAITASQRQLAALSDSTAQQAALSRSAGEAANGRWSAEMKMAEVSNNLADRLAQAADELENKSYASGAPIPPGLAENLHQTANILRDAWEHPDPRVVDNALADLQEQRGAMLKDYAGGAAEGGAPAEAARAAEAGGAGDVTAEAAAPKITEPAPAVSKTGHSKGFDKHLDERVAQIRDQAKAAQTEKPNLARPRTAADEARYKELFGDEQPPARTIPPAAQVEQVHQAVTSNPALNHDAAAFARAHGMPAPDAMRATAQAGMPDLARNIERGTVYPSNMAGGAETARIMQRAIEDLKRADPNRVFGDPKVPADIQISRLQRAAADVVARDHGFPNAQAFEQARPQTAISKIGRIYDGIQRVAIEHWLATPGFLKHVTLSIGTLAGLHGINPMGANPARIARLMPQLRDLAALNHGTSAAIWGERAGHAASATRGVYQGLERALGPAGKILKPLEAAHAGYVEAVPALTHGYEGRIKAAAFEQYFPQGVRAALKDNPAALQTVARMGVPEAGVPSKVAREVTNFLHGAEGPESIHNVFEDARGRNPGSKAALDNWEKRAIDTFSQANPATRGDIADAQRLASKAAARRVNDWMVNRANPTVLDNYAKKVFPFWHYDTQNPLIWARAAAENPLLASGTNTYLNHVNNANAAENRPARLNGYFKMPNIGQGTGDFLNPLRGLGFYKFLNPHNFKGDEGQLGSLFGNLEMNGISPGLFPGMALTAAQRLAGEQPSPRDTFPQSTWLRYALGTGLFNRPGVDVEAPLKNLLYGTSQDKTYDYDVQKELLAQLIRGEKPDLMAAHNEASKHALASSMFAMTKHESPEEQQYLDLAKQRRDLKGSGDTDALKAFDKEHQDLFPWFKKTYGGTPEQLLDKINGEDTWKAPDGTVITFHKDGSRSIQRPDGTTYNSDGKPKTTGAGDQAHPTAKGEMSNGQYVSNLFQQYHAIDENDKVGRAKFIMDHAQELRDHGYDKLSDDPSLQRSYWSNVAKEAMANNDHDALQHASAQLAALQGKEPNRVYRTAAENDEYNKLWDTYRGLTNSRDKAAFFAANGQRLQDLGWDSKTQGSTGGSGSGGYSGRPAYRGSTYRGYSRGPARSYGANGYSRGQNTDRQSWAEHWNAYAQQPDAASKAQYLLDHRDEINGLATKLGKDGVKSSPAQLQVAARGNPSTMPEGVPADVKGQMAWLNQTQARVDSYAQLKDAALQAQTGDSDAINRLGALTQQHQQHFNENLEGLTPEQIADKAILAQADANQLKRYWSANANGPKEAIGHIFDQYRAAKDAGDRVGAARILDQHWDELQALGYKPTFPRPNPDGYQRQSTGYQAQGGPSQAAQPTYAQGGTSGYYGAPVGSQGAPTSIPGVPQRTPEQHAAAQAEAGFWNQYFATKNSGDTAGAKAMLDANRDQVNAWRSTIGKAPLAPAYTTAPRAAAPTPWMPAQRPQMLPSTRGTIGMPAGRSPALPAQRNGGAFVPQRSGTVWHPAPSGGGRQGTGQPRGTVPVSRPQPMHYLQPKPAKGYLVPEPQGRQTSRRPG